MSQRAIRRQHERSEERRLRLERRRVRVGAGLAAGAAALALPAAAEAAQFTVFSLGDPVPGACDGSCTLREAINAANTNVGVADTIVFNAGLSGNINLDQGQLEVTDAAGLTITGPENGVYIDGDGASRVLEVTGGLRLQGPLALQDGYAGSDPGGGILADGASADVELDGTDVRGNQAKYGGGIAVVNDADLTITNSSVSGNVGTVGGGLLAKYGGTVNATDSSFTANGGVQTAFLGGGIAAGKYSDFTGSDLTIRSNGSGFIGGGLGVLPTADAVLADSVVSGNAGFAAGGGIAYFGTDSGGPFMDVGSLQVTNSTVSSNSSQLGGGLLVYDAYPGSAITVGRSTFSGNVVFDEANNGSDYYGTGGGIAINGTIAGPVSVSNSTVSGNSADFGGGMSVGLADPSTTLRAAPALRRQGLDGDIATLDPREREARLAPGGSFAFNSLTIADNTADDGGGGFFNGSSFGGGMTPYNETIPLTNTIVAGNQVGQANNDLGESQAAGGSFQLSYSLVQARGNATIGQSPAGSSILGADPQLGSLRNNGGPTKTMLPAASSPAVDAGNTNLTTDQRGAPRPQGPGDDMGSVEIPDTTVKGAAITVKAKQKMKGKKLVVKLSAGAGEPVEMTASGAVGKTKLKPQTKSAAAGAKASFALKPSKKAGKKLLKKLRKGKKPTAMLSVAFTDNAGNEQTLEAETTLSGKKKKRKKK